MIPAEGLLTALARNWEMVDSALSGLDEAALSWRPTDQANSIAWTLWHMNRVLDTLVHTRLQDASQLWIRDGWHQKFGMDDDPENRGVGWSAAQVAQWNPPAKDVQIGYYEAVKNQTRDFLANVTAEELDISVSQVAIQ